MKRWEALLGRLGSVVTFDYPKPFSNHKRLVEKHAAVIAAIDNAGQRDIYLVGHSMGSRIAWSVRGFLVFLGVGCVGWHGIMAVVWAGTMMCVVFGSLYSQHLMRSRKSFAAVTWHAVF